MALLPVNPGDLITAAAWNEMIDEINLKVNRPGDTMTGPLAIAGGNFDPLTTEGDLKIGDTANWLKIGVATGGAGAGHTRIFQEGPLKALTIGTGANAELNIVNGRVGVGIAAPNQLLDVGGELGTQSLRFNRPAGGNSMSVSRTDQELRVSCGFFGFFFPGAPPFAYKFRVGHDTLVFAGQEPFVQRFAINQNGDATFSGAKSGYVSDFFINKVGDPLETGDVVIVSSTNAGLHYGTGNDIPIPEVDLTNRAYDTRVCGIVASVVAEDDLPTIDPGTLPPEMLQPEEPTTARGKKKRSAEVEELMQPFKGMGAPLAENFDRRTVQPDQMGRMATLGAFAHCKVDADIAAIKPGDLLTTSPTKGHAQKVDDPAKAVGAIIGKALAGLKKGKGKIPVLIMFG